jgi:5'(3')-deoxyribonucleotidase
MANFYPPGFEHEKKNIAIDFDGVIHNADKGWGDGTCYGDPLPGALEALKVLSGKYKIIIFTAKAKSDRPLVDGKTGAMLVTEWLEKHQVSQYVHTVTSDKPRADLYIDDNGYRFENWNDTLKFVDNYEKL